MSLGDGAPPTLDPNFTVRALALALTQTAEDAGRSAFVIGLSGGVDSALAAAIAVRAIGTRAVHGFFLPGPHTSPESRAAAEAAADGLGISLETVEVGPLLAAMGIPETARSRRGNLLARLRMTLLYDRAAAHDALVVGTGNKTELALGYTTLWGDMAADCWPLGDLYKSQVLRIARALELPRSVVDRAPSAELWEGQTDEGELGFSYADADRILYYYLDERRRPDEIEELGATTQMVDEVLGRMRSQAFKRRLPHVPKLSVRTVGHDFHHPRAWRGPA